MLFLQQGEEVLPFIGFRAAGNGTFAQTIAFGQNPSFYIILIVMEHIVVEDSILFQLGIVDGGKYR